MLAHEPPGKAVRGPSSPAAVPAGGDLVDVTIPVGPGLPGSARAAVTVWLDGRAPACVLGDALLLVSELVTNSYLHAGEMLGASVRVRARAYARTLWFEIGDGGRDGDVVRRSPGADGRGGYGLHLVELLASSWGVTHVEGTQVWFTLALPGEAA